MSGHVKRWRVLAACAAALACASSPPPAPTALPAAPDVARPTSEASGPPAELLLEAEAEDAELLGRLLGRSVVAGRAPLAEAFAAGLADTSGRVAVALVLDVSGLRVLPREQVVAAIGVRDFASTKQWLAEAARRTGGELTALSGGQVLLARNDGQRCILAPPPAAGVSRLACGAEPSFSKTAGYLLSRPSMLTTPELRLWAHVPVEALDARFGALLDRARPLLPVLLKTELDRRGGVVARLLTPLASTLSDEGLALLHDVRGITLRLVKRADDWEPKLSVTLRSHGGFVAQLSRDVATAPGTPASFFALPADAELATFSARVPDARAREIQAGLEQWLRAVLGAPFRKSAELMAKVAGPDVPMSYAHGDTLGRDANDKLLGGERLRDVMHSVWGWHVLVYDEPAESYLPELIDGMRAYNDGELRRLVYRELPRLCDGLPPITMGPPIPGLPNGHERFAMRMAGKLFDDCWSRGDRTPAARAAAGAELVVLLIPDGQRAWIGVSTDQKSLLARMRKAPGTLAEDASLADLRDPRAVSGGFVTSRGIASLLRNVAQEDVWRLRRQRFDALPGRGRERVPWKLTVDPDGSLELWARVSERALADVGPTALW